MAQMMKNNGLAGNRSPIGGSRIGRGSPPEQMRAADTNAPDERQRAQRPVAKSLLIGVGGTGVAVISQVKRLLQSQGTPNFYKLLALDTDANSRAGIDGGLSLDDDEFLHVPVDRIATLTENRKGHPALTLRHDLNNPKVHAFMQQLTTANLQQGGQVRAFGNLAMQANWSQIRRKLENLIGELNRPHADIEKQLGANEQLLISEETNIYIIASMAGGTGSSMILELSTLVRELTKNIKCRVVAYFVTAGAFGNVLAGEPVQQIRVDANFYATVMEIFATTSGKLQELTDCQLGPSEAEPLSKTADLWNEINVVQSQDAGGHQYRTPGEVNDRVALDLAAVIGTEIGFRSTQTQANRATAQRITPDPGTGQVRQLGTIATTGLSLNAPRTANVLTNKLLGNILQEQVLGKTTEDINGEICSTFMLQPLGAKSISLKAESIAADLQRQLLVDPARQSETLLKQRTRTRRIHEPARQLLTKVSEMMRRQESTVLPGCRTRCADLCEELKRKLKASLNQKLQSLTTAGGLRMELRFLDGLAVQLKQQADYAVKQRDQAKQSMKQSHDQIQVACRQLDRSLRWWPMDGRRKDRIVDGMAEYLRAMYQQECFATAILILTSLADEVQSLIHERMANGKAVTNRIQQLRQLSKKPATLTAGSDGELDVTTPAVEHRLYSRLCPPPVETMQNIAAKLRISTSELLQRISAETAVYEKVREMILADFRRKLSEISITDVLAEQLEDPDGCYDAASRIRNSVKSCQPMWQAECGLVNQEFSDSMIIGLPRGTSPGAYERVCKQLMAAATQQINPNGQYRAVAQIVETTDQHRVYVIRNTVGACWFYLPELVKAKRSYDEWNRMGGHSVHIFNHATVQKFESVIPADSQNA